MSTSIDILGKENVGFIDGECEGLSVRQLIYQIGKTKPKYIGMNTTYPNFSAFCELAKCIQAEFSSIKIIAGGIHAIINLGEFFNQKDFDNVLFV